MALPSIICRRPGAGWRWPSKPIRSIRPLPSARTSPSRSNRAAFPLPTAAERVRKIAEMLEIADILDRYPTRCRAASSNARAWHGRWCGRRASISSMSRWGSSSRNCVRSCAGGSSISCVRTAVPLFLSLTTRRGQRIADRIAVMEDGLLQQYATPAELKARPANCSSAPSSGSRRMNVFSSSYPQNERPFRFHHRWRAVTSAMPRATSAARSQSSPVSATLSRSAPGRMR